MRRIETAGGQRAAKLRADLAFEGFERRREKLIAPGLVLLALASPGGLVVPFSSLFGPGDAR